jgi:hypothetical protein
LSQARGLYADGQRPQYAASGLNNRERSERPQPARHPHQDPLEPAIAPVASFYQSRRAEDYFSPRVVLDAASFTV